METELDRELAKAQAALLARFAPDTPRQPNPLVAGRDPAARARGRAAAAARARRAETVPSSGCRSCRRSPGSRRVLAVDRPGHGLADPFDYRGVDLLEHARTFLQDILDALELPTADIAANSIGGLLGDRLRARQARARLAARARRRTRRAGARRSAPASFDEPAGRRPAARPAHDAQPDPRRKPEVLGAGPGRAPRAPRGRAPRRRRRAHPPEPRQHPQPDPLRGPRHSRRSARPGRPLADAEGPDLVPRRRARHLRPPQVRESVAGDRRRERERSPPVRIPTPGTCRGSTSRSESSPRSSVSWAHRHEAEWRQWRSHECAEMIEKSSLD